MNIEILENYRDDKEIRDLFFEFTPKALYGADFKKWYELGCWDNRYKPFSIIIDGLMVSNVSISELDIYLDNKILNALQFATVGTLPEYRNQGYSRHLMEYVLNKYKGKIDLYYLFANENVIDFYPKFEFKRKFEGIFKSKCNPIESVGELRKLHVEDIHDFEIIRDLLKNRHCETRKFSPIDYDFVTLWHIIYVYPQNIYYDEKEKNIFIFTHKGKKLHLFDVISCEKLSFDSNIKKKILNPKIEEIYYYFDPEEIGVQEYKCISDEEGILFVRGDFSLVDREFKYPITGQT